MVVNWDKTWGAQWSQFRRLLKNLVMFPVVHNAPECPIPAAMGQVDRKASYTHYSTFLLISTKISISVADPGLFIPDL